MPISGNGKLVYWYIGSDNTVYVNGLILDSAYQSTATVSGQLKTTAGVNVGSTITFSYVTGSSGQYKGILSDTTAATLTRNTEYWMDITCTAQSGEVLVIRLQGPAIYAGS